MVALGEQLRGKRMALCLDTNAAAGVWSMASSRVPVVLAIIEISGDAQHSSGGWPRRELAAIQETSGYGKLSFAPGGITAVLHPRRPE